MNYIDSVKKERRPFLDWLFPKNEEHPAKKYSDEDVEKLIEDIKVFNAGAIDEYLSKHVDDVYNKWKSNFGDNA